MFSSQGQVMGQHTEGAEYFSHNIQYISREYNPPSSNVQLDLHLPYSL